MSVDPNASRSDVGDAYSGSPTDEGPRPGQGPIVMAGLAIGILMMGIQLWLLTVAVELYLGGDGQVWPLAVISGVIFVGGLLMLRLLSRRPRVRRSPPLELGPNGR